MNEDQIRNIDQAIKGVGHSLHTCWTYLHLLKGLQEGANDDRGKETLLTHPFALAVAYQAVFDALYAAIGTISDRTPGTLSLPGLVKMARKYSAGERGRRHLLSSVEDSLTDKDNGPFQKLERWRHKHVAHRTSEALLREFHDMNRLKLGEVESAIEQLEALVNQISEEFMQTRYDWKSTTDRIAVDAASLITRSSFR